MTDRTGIVTFAGKPVTLTGNEIKVGDKAPDFTGTNQSLEPVKFSSFAGKTVVIAVYPSIDTGVCQKQNYQFNKIASEMNDLVVLSVSLDLPFAHKRYCAAEGLNNIITLSDYKDREFGNQYGYLIKELALLARGTVVIDKKGIVQLVEFVPEITTEPNYDATLKVLKKIR
ncbi:MAG: thiol peroxidase [Prolixibacteraceae bacterium]|nr:thiol peroxidase [Prolixibacteraceae bacterium]MBN2650133.1 thiol peroxidase [Prolixibacteraceae bacterium]